MEYKYLNVYVILLFFFFATDIKQLTPELLSTRVHKIMFNESVIIASAKGSLNIHFAQAKVRLTSEGMNL